MPKLFVQYNAAKVQKKHQIGAKKYALCPKKPIFVTQTNLT